MRLVSEKGKVVGRARPIIVPAVIIIAISIILFAIFCLLQSRRLNTEAEAKEQSRLHTAFEADLSRMASEVNRTANLAGSPSEPATSELEIKHLRRITADHGSEQSLNQLFIIRRGAVAVAVGAGQDIDDSAYQSYAPWVSSRIEAASAIMGARLRGTVSGEADMSAGTTPELLSFLLADAIGSHILTVKEISGPAADAHATGMVVGVRHLTNQYLLELSHAANIGPLRSISAREPGQAILSVDLPQLGGVRRDIGWSPLRPGDAFLANVSMSMVILTALFVVLVALHTRRVMLELSSSEARARNIAGHDQLSGLPNRLLFAEILEHEIARQRLDGDGFALLYVDLDRFKEINDSLGHDAGDEMIREVSRRIRAALQPDDVIARIGGDEFALLVRGGGEISVCTKLAERLLAEMAKPFLLLHSEIKGGLSIGIAQCPLHAIERQDLMRKSDLALYRAKQGGRNRYVVYDDYMDAGLQASKKLEKELRIALSQNGLALHYQPIMSGDGLRIVAVEALARWPHPELGMIMPDCFIPLAEERGLILALGHFVMRRAMMDGLKWPSLRVAVNVSPIQFRSSEFVSRVKRCLAETGFEPSRLEIELTEGVLVEDAEQAKTAMNELRELGVRMSLDDFGTGYSSLIYLRQFPFDKIKIDRAFLRALEATGESAIIVHSVVHLGRALGLTVTAEGVETKEQQRFLQAVGCHELQGYLFASAQPAEVIDRLMRTNEPLGGMAATVAA